MDLNTISEIKSPATAAEVTDWRSTDAWLAGGTWLFSEPQIATQTLIDIEPLGWPALTATPDGLEIAATCKVVELDQFTAPPEWTAAPLIPQCCRQSKGVTSLVAQFALEAASPCQRLPF